MANIEERLGEAEAKLAGIETIVIPPGRTNPDEFMAMLLALELGRNVQKVVKRAATAADLNNPHTLVLDQGLRNDPAKSNFDHHQDKDSVCTFHLLARHLGLDEALRANDPSYAIINTIDTKGVPAAEAEFGMKPGTANAIRGSIGLLAVEALMPPSGEVGAPELDVLRRMGNNYIDRHLFIEPEMRRLGALPVQQVEGTDISYITDLGPSNARKIFVEQNGISAVLTATESRENRGAVQLTLIRTDGTDLDFRQVPQELLDRAGVTFVHPGSGYMLKFGVEHQDPNQLPIAEILAAAQRQVEPQGHISGGADHSQAARQQETHRANG